MNGEKKKKESFSDSVVSQYHSKKANMLPKMPPVITQKVGNLQDISKSETSGYNIWRGYPRCHFMCKESKQSLMCLNDPLLRQIQIGNNCYLYLYVGTWHCILKKMRTRNSTPLKVESLHQNRNVHWCALETARMTAKLRFVYQLSAPFSKYCSLRTVQWSLWPKWLTAFGKSYKKVSTTPQHKALGDLTVNITTKVGNEPGKVKQMQRLFQAGTLGLALG